MVKVARFRLICHQTDEDGNEIDYKDIYHILWELQRQTREIKNKAIQICWDFQNRSYEHYRLHGEYLKEKTVFGMSLRGHLDKELRQEKYLYSSNMSATSTKALQEFNAAKKEIFSGTKSILSYKKNQPLELYNKAIKLKVADGNFYVNLNLLNKAGIRQFNYPYFSICFKMEVRDNSQKTILNRCIAGEYKVTGSRMVYDEKSRRWVLNLGYEFETKETESFEPDRILGVDLGIHYPVCASVYGEYPRFTVDGGEIEEFRKRVESRKRSLQRQGKYCGDGRIGHGRATRCKPVDNIEDRIARFRDTCNHKYSKALIDFAIKQRCGAIQMEDLTGITSHENRFLKSWSYYDLQTKIEYKAKAVGIRVMKVSPEYTSQRCSKCGHIDPGNRTSQQVFLCLNCGYEANADYNASQNLAIAGIDKIIQKQKKCEPEADE